MNTADTHDTAPAMENLDRLHDIRLRIDAVLTTFLDTKAVELPGGDIVKNLMADIRLSVLHGGKRLRPLLCYLGWLAAGGNDRPEAVTAAASLELFHTAALAHDDIMDASDTRRGYPTLHRRLARLYPGHQPLDRVNRFATSAAIIAGDLCLMWSDEMLQTSGLTPNALHEASPLLATMRTEVMIGQYLDICPPPNEGSWRTYADMVNLYKTARYTITRPLQIGGALAGATGSLLASYLQIGDPLGHAFQLRDDLLGVYGHPDITGKPNIDDLREGKRTVLIALALQHATPEQATIIRTTLGAPNLTHDQAQQLRTILTDTGARRQTERLITTKTQCALNYLHTSSIPTGPLNILSQLAVTLTNRSC
jgi:geranylgeranyl diphosphate synthase type I